MYVFVWAACVCGHPSYFLSANILIFISF